MTDAALPDPQLSAAAANDTMLLEQAGLNDSLRVEIAAPGTPQEFESSMSPKIAILGDVELRVDVILGRARRTLQDLLSIRPSQTIELDRQRNSPVEILVNNKAFALGEIVVIDETNLGVRVLEILDGGLGGSGRAQ